MRHLPLTLALIGFLALAASSACGRPEDSPNLFGPNSVRLRLVSEKAVQDELQLTDEQRDAVRDLQKQVNNGDLTSEVANEKVAAILRDAQAVRLKEIGYQFRGGAALRDEEVARAVGYDDGQRQKINKIWDEEDQKLQDALRRLRFKSENDRQAYIIKHLRAAGERVLAVLTMEQRKTFEKLKGKNVNLASLGG